MLTKVTVEAVLNAELDEYLGYSKHETSDNFSSPNGASKKRLRTEDREFNLETPRGRGGRVILPFLTEVKSRRLSG